MTTKVLSYGSKQDLSKSDLQPGRFMNGENKNHCEVYQEFKEVVVEASSRTSYWYERHPSWSRKITDRSKSPCSRRYGHSSVIFEERKIIDIQVD